MSSRSSTPKLQTSKQQQAPVRSNAPSPSPSTANNSTTTTLPDLSTLLNLPLQVTTTGDNSRTIKATLYTYDPSSSILVLSSPSSSSSSSTTAASSSSSSAFSTKRNYHLLKTSQISSLEILSSTPDPLFPSPSLQLPSPSFPLSPQSLSQKVQTSITRQEKEQSRLGPRGITSEHVQKVFDLLSKTLPVRWTEKGEIVVMDEVVVDPRNDEWSIKGGKGSKDRIERVGKVLEGIRARVAANGGSQTPTIG
ncbi:hypothetical protein JCM5350_001051 [Sporobolomyces pararoseus]